MVLKHDPMFFRCGSEANDVHFLCYHILNQDETPLSRRDIDVNSDIAQSLLGKATGQNVNIPIVGTDVYLDYTIVDISRD